MPALGPSGCLPTPRCRCPLGPLALPATVLGFAVLYPFLIQQSSYQRFLFEVPVFKTFPSIDTMAVGPTLPGAISAAP